MLGRWIRVAAILLVTTATTGFAQAEPTGELVHFGMCDASAAVAVGAEFFLVANDEDNALRLYRRDRGGQPLGRYELSSFLRTERDHPEADIEGAARLGDVVYWITSHGRNKDGKSRPNRYRLFATRVQTGGNTTTVVGVGLPYTRLLADLLAADNLAPFDLAKASRRAPKDKDALNIEGLAATPDGRLLIGFRNPIRRGRALIVPLNNPRDVIRGAMAQIGEPLELELDGLGVRSLEYDAARGDYLFVAGPYDGEDACRMFRWSGGADSRPEELRRVQFGDWTPEAIVLYADRANQVQILSDDGTRQVEGDDCKALASEQSRRFRSGWVQVD